MKKFIIISILFLPTFAFAQMPAFPMALYGSAIINDSPAPIGTTIRAYYGNVSSDNLAGEVVIKENGIYGYDAPTGQKLLIKEGGAKITFTFQSASILNNQETSGNSEVSYPSFNSGSIKLDLAFKYDVPVPSVPPTPPRGGGGGGGGGSGSRNNTVSTLPPNGQVLGTNTFNFTRNLSIGSSGNDVVELQNRLTAEGIYSSPISGYFGYLTGVGVKAYQLKYGIQQLGIVGPATRAKLNQGTGAVLGAQNTAMTAEQMKILITRLQTQLANLMLKLGKAKN